VPINRKNASKQGPHWLWHALLQEGHGRLNHGQPPENPANFMKFIGFPPLTGP
jgi:hypothetical protein